MTWKAHALKDGFWWMGIEIRGIWTPIYRAGRIGDCIRF
ncbi:hypothetical protein V1VFAS_027 [Rhizobium phage V1VFA-S]|nr:hypothetical protein B1VFA_050 [Rhizobium phage B1VFA]QNH71775.1 hypothetical protein V1VFAS_027 [Rhizobium phage V1VFA-S]